MLAERLRIFAANIKGTLAAMSWQVRSIFVMFAGAFCVLALPPIGFWPALFIGLSIFYAAVATTNTVRQGFLYGWLFGFTYFLFGLYWIGNALLVEGGEYKWAWPLAVAGLPLALSLFFACAIALNKLVADMKEFSGFLAFIIFLPAFEWLRGHIFTGFPWNLLGYSWHKTLEIAQLASVGGIYWLSLVTVIWAALPGYIVISAGGKKEKAALALLLLISFGCAFVYGSDRLTNNPTQLAEKVAVRLVQPNIAQKDKWDSSKTITNLEKILELSKAEPVNEQVSTLIVWPETMVAQKTLEIDAALALVTDTMAGYKGNAVLATGILRYATDEISGTRHYYNSLALLDKELKTIDVYDKSHLVPFGEYIPMQEWIPLAPVASFVGFDKGSGPAIHNIEGFGKVSLLVCYEIIFPGKITPDGSNRPDWIINVTNDAWYGDSTGPYQHFAMAVFRAIEEGIPVIRAANTGISGVIDPVGRTVHKADLMTESGRNWTLPRPLEQKTIFILQKNSLFFSTIITLCVILMLMVLFKNRRT